MTSEECVASCASTLSSAGKTTEKVAILDSRGGFSRAELDLNPEETFSQLFERAELKSPIDPKNDVVEYIIDQTKDTLLPSDFVCKLADKKLSGSVKIIIRSSLSLNPEDVLALTPTMTDEMQDIQEHIEDDGSFQSNDGNDERDMEALINSAPPPPPPVLAVPKLTVSGINPMEIADAVARKAQNRSSDAVLALEEKRAKTDAKELGKIVAAEKTTSTTSTCNKEDDYRNSYDCRSSTGFAGLNNQGATCYMNSLIQSLYMNPEFRKMVYDWSFEDHYQAVLKRERKKHPDMTPEQEQEFRKKKEENSIPLQLQRLFAMLQLTTARAVSTKKLTKSFAWDASDAFTQHDVTELRAVLFEALEKAMAGTSQATAVKELFEGEVLEYVRCLGCQHESVKKVPLYEALLDIKVFGEPESVKSVEEAMRKFITPEVLDEDNLYACDACGNKCRAVKGTRFTKFPYFFVMQMKRFDFDFVTMNRVKLCDRVSFPYTFDASDYIEGGKIDKELMEKATKCKNPEEKPEEDDAMTDAQEPPAAETSATAAVAESEVPAAEAPAAAAAAATPETTDAEKKDDLIYDLYAILIHSGSANGGHYYAYIKDYRSGKWFQFNDSSVSEINDADIKSVFGKEAGAASSYGGSSYYMSNSFGTTAYMLMYRKVDPEKNMLPCTDEEVPEQLREYVEVENAREAEKRLKEKLERETYHITVTYEGKTKKFDRHFSTTIGELKNDVLKEFECTANPEDSRLLLVDNYSKKSTSLDDDSETLEKSVITSWNKDLSLEVKEPGAEWVIKNPNLITVILYIEDKSKEGETPKKSSKTLEGMAFTDLRLTIDKTKTFGDLRKMASEKFGISVDRLRLLTVPRSSYDDCDTVTDDNAILDKEFVRDDDEFFVEECDTPLEKATSENSPLMRFAETVKNTVSYKVHPPVGEPFDISPFDQRRPLKELKQLIAEKTGIAFDRIVLKRGTVNWKTEMKDMDLSAKANYLYDGDFIFVEEGVMGSHNCRVFLWRSDTGSLDLLFRESVVESELLSEYISRVVAKYIEKFGDDPKYPKAKDPSCYVMRESSYDGYFPGGYLDRNATVKSVITYLSENTRFVLDVVAEPPKLPEPENLIHVFCYEWHPESLVVDPVGKEIIVDKHAPINDIRRSLAAVHRQYPVPSEPQAKPEETPSSAAGDEEKTTPKEGEMVPQEEEKIPAAESGESVAEGDKMEDVNEEVLPEDICITTLNSYGRIETPQVSFMMSATEEAPNWEVGATITPSDIPKLYLRDGITIAFWNGKAKQKELTDEEKAKLTKPTTYSYSSYSSNYNSNTSSSSYSSYWSRKETAIKIHVDEDSDSEDEGEKDKEKNPTEGTTEEPAAAAAAAAATTTTVDTPAKTTKEEDSMTD